MKTSQTGIDLIKKFEGCRLKAYKCAADVWTIGYGHTKGVEPYEIITLAEAEKLLKEDLEKYERNVEKYHFKYGWNQNEFDALVSFAFNLGSIDKLVAGGTRNRATIAEKMLTYNKISSGKVLAGLTKRRQAERELFLKPMKQTYVSKQKSTDGSGVVRAVQKWLNDTFGSHIKVCDGCGNALLETDGKYGPKTKSALAIALQVWLNKDFNCNIRIVGKWNDETERACKKYVAIYQGDTSRGSQIVQAILYCNKYNPQLFDEEFTKDCEKALKEYQKDLELAVDGIAGRRFFESALS